jgi:hypothetical protein
MSRISDSARLTVDASRGAVSHRSGECPLDLPNIRIGSFPG